MQNTTKLYVIKIGNLIVASIEGFTKVDVKCDIQKNYRFLLIKKYLTKFVCITAHKHVNIVFHSNLFSIIIIKVNEFIKVINLHIREILIIINMSLSYLTVIYSI